MARRASLAAIATLVVAGVSASGAAALDNPELLYREGVSESEPLGPWLPLDGAHINGLGFIVGTRQQAKPAQDSTVYHRLTALAVPDGHPDQGPPFDPARPCIAAARTPGSEVALGTGRFEGPGSYTIELEVNLPSSGATPSSCSGGPASTATFTIDPTVAVMLVGTAPVVVPRNSLERITSMVVPAGGQGETRCARGAAIQADGSVAGADRTGLLGFEVVVRQIPRAGRWTCVGRARGAVSNADDGEHYTRWGPPVSFDAVSDFSAKVSVPDRRPKRYTVAYSALPPGSEGAKVTLRLSPGKRCPKVATRTVRATVGDDLAVRLAFTLPERNRATLTRRGIDSYGWRYRLDFGGTALVRPGRVVGSAFVTPARFTHVGGHVLQWGKETAAFCTRTA
jgi:hypothetical protein